MFCYKQIYFVIFALIICKIGADISDKRLCIDSNCSELISVGKTLLKYHSIGENILSFNRNEEVKVYSYGAGSNPDLIGVEINGKRGYINKVHIQETKLVKRPKLVVNTEWSQDKPEVPSEGVADEIKADPTKQPFEIVDGTKIPLDPQAFATTESDVYPTTESPLVIDEKQDSTKPLESVSDINQAPPSKIDTKLAQNSREDDDTEDDDDDDEEEEDEEDSDEEHEENDERNSQEHKTIQDNTKNNSEESVSVKQAIDSNNVSNASDDNLTNKNVEEVVVDNTQDIPVDTEKREELPVKSNETKQITLGENDISEHSKVESSETLQNDTDSSKTSAENLEVVSNQVESTEKVVNQNPDNVDPVKDPINADGDQKEEQLVTGEKASDAVSVEPPEVKLNEVEPSLPESNLTVTTEIPLEVEVVPPLNIDSTTPSYIESSSAEANEVSDVSSKNYSEEKVKAIELDSNFVPEFKDVEESSSVKIQDTASPGLVGGLGNILPLFNSAQIEDIKPKDEPPEVSNEDQPITDEKLTTPPMESLLEEPESVKEINEPDLDLDTTKEDKIDDTDDSLLEMKNEDLHQDENTDESKAEEMENQYVESLGDSQEISSGGFFSKVLSLVGFGIVQESVKSGEEIDNSFKEDTNENVQHFVPPNTVIENIEEKQEFCNSDDNCPQIANKYSCDKESQDFPTNQEDFYVTQEKLTAFLTDVINSDIFLYLVTTALSVIILFFGSIIFDKCRREGPLIARINKLEKQLLTTMKENEMLQEKIVQADDQKSQLVVDSVPNEVVEELNQKLAEMAIDKQALEEQIQALEKELDNSTEVGIELNKIISEMLNSTDGSEILKENVEQMKKELVEQQYTINSVNKSLSLSETENHELRLELEISNKKVADLQGEVDKMVDKILKIEEERDQQNSTLEKEIAIYQTKCKEGYNKEHLLNSEIQVLKQQLTELQRVAEIKVREYNTLKNSLEEVKLMRNNKDALKSLLQISEIKAQLEQMKCENLKYSEQLAAEKNSNIGNVSQIQALLQEISELREKYERADKAKIEINTKLDVLNNYFKEKEEQMQKEIGKYESLWVAKEGEATSITERIKYMQEELQNYKAQNESLKQEIINQEVELKSQISMLEKKSHESWVTNRQTERKLEEARQEAAQLRNRLTMRERTMVEGNNQTRIQSPLHQNGELPMSPPPLDPTQSPPPLFNPRDHITKSPPLPGMPPPPPFLPLPLGTTSFILPPPLDGIMPPPLNEMGGMPPFMTPLPLGMFPGDHRPPPLGRMSSPPPVGGRYTPESTVYSEYDRYDRRSPSPLYDSEYRASPPSLRAYSPYNDRLRDDRRDYKRPQARSNGRNSKGIHSSGSENDSLGKVNKKSQRKV